MIMGCPLGIYMTCSVGVRFLTLTLDDEEGILYSAGVVGLEDEAADAVVRREAEDERRCLPRSG